MVAVELQHHVRFHRVPPIPHPVVNCVHYIQLHTPVGVSVNYRVTSVTGPEGVANSTSSFYRGRDFAQREYAVCFRAHWYLELELPWFSSRAR